MSFRDILTKDAGWKVLSVIVAVVIWLAVHKISVADSQGVSPVNGAVTHSFQSVPVLVVSAAADVREFKVRPAAVQITVSGTPEAVTALDPRQIHVLVDLTGIQAASDLKKRVDVSTPPGITFISAAPAEVDVMVPPKKTK
jgi:YbbR domain-containing protein